MKLSFHDELPELQREKHTASQSITSSFDAQAFSAFSALIPYVVGIRIMSIHVSCDMYLRLGLHVQIRLYYLMPYQSKISAQHGTGFILDQCIVYLGLTVPNLQKKRLLIFEIFNIKKCTLFFFGTEYMTQNLKFALGKLENIVGKGENAG